MKPAPIGINVGASKETIQELGKVVLAILKEPGADQMTKSAAIEAVIQTVQIQNVSIHGCSISMGAK